MNPQIASSNRQLSTEIPLGELIATTLIPHITAIDLEGHYPETFLRDFGQIGGFADVISTEHGGSGRGLSKTIAAMAQVSERCVSTGFLIWCQTACARYIELSDNPIAQARWLPDLAIGRQLGGTGLSNTFKAASQIEPSLLRARRDEGGYRINGTLPWVSNLGPDHIFVTGCPVDGTSSRIFFVVDCRQDDFRLLDSAHFTAMEGTRTLACQFKETFIPDAQVLAHPDQSVEYLRRIQPGMILGQTGMAIGLVRDCIRLTTGMEKSHGHINAFETIQANNLTERLENAESEIYRLSGLLDQSPDTEILQTLMTDILRVRLAGGELSLEAAQAALLHQGARGYIRTAAPQRRLREAYFVAIVTPSLKHLRREIARRKEAAKGHKVLTL